MFKGGVGHFMCLAKCWILEQMSIGLHCLIANDAMQSGLRMVL